MNNEKNIERRKKYLERINKKESPRKLGTAKSLSGYIKIISKNVSGLYRGQRKEEKLLPKLFRIVKNENVRYLKGDALLKYEKDILEKFKNRTRLFLKFEPKNDLEWLAVAQHYGLNTRLLDWTENALIALWFCVEKGVPELYNKRKNYGVVYRFWNKIKFNPEVTKDDKENPFNIDFLYTKIYHPPYISERIIAQSAVFTIHIYNKNEDSIIPMEEDEDISKIIIPYDSFETIKKELLASGIHSASIYPDIEGVCKLLNYEFENEKERLKNLNEFDKKFLKNK